MMSFYESSSKGQHTSQDWIEWWELDLDPATFRKERMEFVRRLDAYDEAFVQRTALHPRLKAEIRVIDLVFFIVVMGAFLPGATVPWASPPGSSMRPTCLPPPKN